MTALAYIDPPELHGRPITGTLDAARRARPAAPSRWEKVRCGMLGLALVGSAAATYDALREAGR